MNVELQMLVWSVVLGLVQVVVAATGVTGQRGLDWAASARDATPTPLTGVVARLDRARANFMETFALFAAVVLAGCILQRHTATTVLGAQLYFWARLIYVPVYALGIPYLRTLIWSVSIVGIAMLLISLF
ncbi:membrane protein [Dyella lipolytica]|uniref:MAPEG family protein n=1 Tax=Dyella lipolytica TaxID=1867835 RepID=A0ABW8ITN8_9GAMM|nr:MAPEG family protein [Dyella lipolytica]GLQ47002.1 membrane protein [Dyella lipolytica]